MFWEHIGLKHIVDVVIVAVLLYSCYKVMRQTRSLAIFYGILVFVGFWIFVSKVLEMKLIGNILDQLVSVGAIAFIILFQEEIRQFLYRIGTTERRHRLARFLSLRSKADESVRNGADVVGPIVNACRSMSNHKVGALIVLQNDIPLNSIAETGEEVDAKITTPLIENIFFKNSPLHDGAMIIADKRIRAAGCLLPISHDLDMPKDFGLRHRAAKGISNDTDALAVVVSEETGQLTVAWRNQFRTHIEADELEAILMKGRF